ncbi:hypothetical protein [uncultured Nostoc sp.]|uniref:hypothetical protein n=1 Tax=uncultured Nostoc sp. TaxID=340711 RepID=UPI0035CC42F9
MSNINTQDLYSIELVQDLDHEDAATVNGGKLYLSGGYNNTGYEIAASKGIKDLGKYDDTASWYQVTGNKGWYAYTGKYYTGDEYYLAPYSKGNFKGNLAGANDDIESIRPA